MQVSQKMTRANDTEKIDEVSSLSDKKSMSRAQVNCANVSDDTMRSTSQVNCAMFQMATIY